MSFQLKYSKVSRDLAKTIFPNLLSEFYYEKSTGYIHTVSVIHLNIYLFPELVAFVDSKDPELKLNDILELQLKPKLLRHFDLECILLFFTETA